RHIVVGSFMSKREYGVEPETNPGCEEDSSFQSNEIAISDDERQMARETSSHQNDAEGKLEPGESVIGRERSSEVEPSATLGACKATKIRRARQQPGGGGCPGIISSIERAYRHRKSSKRKKHSLILR